MKIRARKQRASTRTIELTSHFQLSVSQDLSSWTVVIGRRLTLQTFLVSIEDTSSTSNKSSRELQIKGEFVAKLSTDALPLRHLCVPFSPAAVPGYILGSVLYFGIPFSLGTVLGLGGVALQNSPSFPTFGRMLSSAELNAGLVLPYTAQAVAGKGGAAAAALIVFLTCTSTISAQLVAVSSILSMDVYRTYLYKKATDSQTINISRWSCLGFAIVASGFSVLFYEVGLSLTWTLYFLGIITVSLREIRAPEKHLVSDFDFFCCPSSTQCPGMVTLPLTVLWSRQTKLAAIISPIAGITAGIIVWLITAAHYAPGGVLNVTTTGELLPCLWGTIAATMVPIVLAPAISLIWPTERFDWARFNDIKLVSSDDSSSVNTEKVPKSENEIITPDQEKYMRSRSWVAAWVSIFLFIAVWIVWPCKFCFFVF